jgi:predicted small lipoprotein YifL
MRRNKLFILLLFPLLALASCEDHDRPGPLRLPEGDVYHDMIQLGDKLDDPYTVDNMRGHPDHRPLCTLPPPG